MTLTLAPSTVVAGSAGAGSAITISIFGDEIGSTGTDSFKLLHQGVLGTSPATLYTVGGSAQHIVKTVALVNVTAAPVAVAMFVGGTADANRIAKLTIPASGSASYGSDGWSVYDAAGVRQYVGATGPTGAKGANYRGAYAGGTTYAIDDVVFDGGSSWIAVSAGSGVAPPTLPTTSNARWSLLASKGDKGDIGNTGLTGGVGPQGDKGWAPVFAVASDGIRRVLQLTDWTGGAGTKPGNINDYVSVSGFTSVIANAIDIRGPQGTQGPTGEVTTSQLNSAISTHEGLANPHPNYATDTDLANHAGAADPHPGYLTVTEGNAAYQPLDGDLTSIAALTTTAYGRGFLDLADAAAGRTKLALGTAATSATGDFQPADSDLTAIAALTTTAFGRGHLTLADAAAATAQLNEATPLLKGLISSGDKRIIDSLHYDIVADYGWVGNDATDNFIAAGARPTWATIMASLPTGARLFFPAGTYRTSDELTINVDKRITFVGANRYASIIKTTSATANIFHKSVAGWYDAFIDLGFQSSVTKTAGSAIHISAGNNVGMNVYRCWMTGMFKGISAIGAQSANLSVWADLDISGITNGGRGLHIDGDTINIMIHNATINAGPATTSACCEINRSGAVQVTACDWIQGTNVLLLNSNAGAGPQAVYFTNCFFDQPQGSVVKIVGTNTANRIKFTQCGIAPTGNADAVEINGTGVGAVGTATALPAGISFVDCDIYAQNGTNTGAGIRLNGVQDVNIQNTRITGFNGAGGCGIRCFPSAGAVTKLRVNGCIIGPNSNLTVTNETAVKIESGVMGFLSITDNSLLGNGTAINDLSTVPATATKNIRDNQGAASGLSAQAVAGSTITTTTETVVLQIYLPPNSVKVGTTFRFFLATTVSATTTTVVRVRVGTAGTIADAALIQATSAASGAAATVTIDGASAVTAVGAAASHNGGIQIVQAAVAGGAPAITASGTFNTTVGNYVSVTLANGTANTRTIRAGEMAIYSPA